MDSDYSDDLCAQMILDMDFSPTKPHEHNNSQSITSESCNIFHFIYTHQSWSFSALHCFSRHLLELREELPRVSRREWRALSRVGLTRVMISIVNDPCERVTLLASLVHRLDRVASLGLRL